MLYLDSEHATEATMNKYYQTIYRSDDGPVANCRLDSLAQFLLENCESPILDIGGTDGKLAGRLSETMKITTSGPGDALTETYKTIVLSHTLEHVYNMFGLMKSIVDHLSPGGQVVVEVPIWKGDEDVMGYDYHLQHCNKFTPEKLAELFLRHRFQVVSSQPLPDYIEYHCHRLVAKMPVGAFGKKKFHMTRNPDHDDALFNAIAEAGYREAGLQRADFVLHDAIHEGYRLKGDKRPVFVFPHTPQSWFLWDGLLPVDRVDCNFVHGPGALRGMRAYGYPHRIESVGFTRCEVKEFCPTSGHRLMIVPAHRIRNGDYPEPGYKARAMQTIRRLFDNRTKFETLTVCWDEPEFLAFARKYARDPGIQVIPTNPHIDRDPLKTMMRRIEDHDLVISCGTVGCVSVAMGKPTVFFTEQGVPHTPPKREAAHFDLYKDIIRHPLMAEQMTMDDILAVCKAPDPRAEQWKQDNIGGNFDAAKFIGIVQEYVK